MPSVLSFLRTLHRRVGLSRASYVTSYLKPPVRLVPTSVNKTEKADIIKRLNRENKELFGELHKTKKAQASKKEKLASDGTSEIPEETVFVELKKQNRGPKSELKAPEESVIIPMPSPFQPDGPLQITKAGGNEQNAATQAMESSWMDKNFPKGMKRIIRPNINSKNPSVILSIKKSSTYPSVTRILSSTMSPERQKILKKWEKKMIEELGEEGFKEYKQELFRNGEDLHRNIQELLSGKSEEDLEISNPIEGHWKSLRSVLEEIQKVYALESYVSHPELQYAGIVDCVAAYRDKLVLIDWKTSEKPKPFLSNTYDTPIQIAAYVGALNADPQYNMKVDEGMAVIAYKDGKDCQIFHLDANGIRKYWSLWMQRLKLYQTRELA